ncbi:recombinase family protein [Pseudarthrobacter sp. Y6]|uniref:recombinase family protein n=1 Tax=Pseudarthrobacter sp. Y6 TaxID=3418422 RepID=UPI003CEFC5C3
MDIGYARVSTAKQALTRQLDALAAAGITREHIFVDKKSGATTARAGLQAALTHARDGDVLVVHTLDRLGRTVRDTLNMVHELKERGVGIRTLADPLAIDTAEPDSPMSQLAFVMLELQAPRRPDDEGRVHQGSGSLAEVHNAAGQPDGRLGREEPPRHYRPPAINNVYTSP